MASIEQIDPELMQDFVTEALELIDSAGQDLVTLEQQPDNVSLLNSIFRAWHTIKGSSSFLGLGPLTEFAHVAEDALNTLRKSADMVTADTMDLLLRAADVVQRQVEQVSQGQMPEAGPADLVTALTRLSQGGSQRDEVREQEDVPNAASSGAAEQAAEETAEVEALNLSASKQDLLPFMAADLSAALAQLRLSITALNDESKLNSSIDTVAELTDGLLRSVDFFELSTLVDEVGAIHQLVDGLGDLDPADREAVVSCALELVDLLERRAAALTEGNVLRDDSTAMRAQLQHLLHPSAQPSNAGQGTPEDSTSGPEEAAAPGDGSSGGGGAASNAGIGSADRTIRVDVARLESLLNLVGELVLQKNRVLGVSRRMSDSNVDHDMLDDLALVGSDLERVTSELQMGVMKTRMQPLSKLFNRYPRLIRDLARNTGKQIDLVITGGDTEVDKSVIESLGDPLVHLLRNAGDHGIEPPDQRQAAGKPPLGRITLSAGYEGNHVLVKIADDGRGLDTERIKAKAVDRGMITAEQAEGISRSDLLNLVFMPGLSTAEQVSDISGRGVGMDVVRSNIARMNGMVEIESEKGVGSTVSIRVPLTVAIMPAMIVVFNEDQYALPLSNIIEIVRAEEHQLSSVGGAATIRVRDQVLPLVDLAAWFGGEPTERRTVVIVGLGEKRLGLRVDALVGQQEIVIKPLDEFINNAGVISGATIREDGGVSLILDVASLFKQFNRNVHQPA